MTKRQIFYSFHYEKDVWRVQQIRNMGVIDGNTLVLPNEWEEVKKRGDNAIKKWIDDAMQYRSCLVVLIGEETASRKWVQYEIEKAWELRKGVVGIYIHNLRDSDGEQSPKGNNPFELFELSGKKFSNIVKCYNPSPTNTFNDIKENIQDWIEEAIEIREKY